MRIAPSIHRLAILVLLATPVLAGLDPGDWKIRQAVPVQNAGVVRLALPLATLDATRANLEDLRLVDPAGNEIPYLIERAARPAPSAPRRPVSFVPALSESATTLVVEANPGMPLDAILLSSPATSFVKAARVEVSPDGNTWTLLQEGTPIFRQGGTENLRIELRTQASRYTRITLDDRRTPPVPFTQAMLVPGNVAAPTYPELRIVSSRREDFAGETVFTIDLGAKNVSLASIAFEATNPVFTRIVSVGVRELRDDVAVERALASGSIYRVAIEGAASRTRLEIPLEISVPNRELLVHVANGDSPPLAGAELKFRQLPVWLLFHAEVTGNFTLLTGNLVAAKPRYDVVALGGISRISAPADVTVGAPEPNPAYRASTPLGDADLLGAPLDPAPWNFRKAVHIGQAGMQELELDFDVLSRAQPRFADLRLVQNGSQVPYLLERAGLNRTASLVATPLSTPNRPRTTRWEIKLPRAGLPLARLTLASPTTLFQRDLRLFETVNDRLSGTYDRPLAVASWSHAPGDSSNLVLNLGATPATDRLFLETDNGDNQPIAIGSVTAAVPVTRLLFKATNPASPLRLYYGNRGVAPPRYDLALISTQILAAEKSPATLGSEENAQAGGWAAKALGGLHGGPLLWTVLALVIVVLLVVVAKLLPKPAAPSE